MNIHNIMPPYNSEQEALLMPEYGRTVQQMVQKATRIVDRTQRQQCANAIVAIMARIQKDAADQPNFAHKLWNNLARMAHYKLDIDYPVDIVPEEETATRPAPLPYPSTVIKRRHYGTLTEQMLHYLTSITDENELARVTRLAIDHMRKDIMLWNKGAMEEATVKKDFAYYTQGKVQWPADYQFTPLQIKEPYNVATKKKKKRK